MFSNQNGSRTDNLNDESKENSSDLSSINDNSNEINSNQIPNTSMKYLINSLKELIEIASNYDLDFSQTPLLKPLLLLTGSQSAGKSAIINYLYSMSLRNVGEQAIDEKFTVIECVSEYEFIELSGKKYKSKKSFNIKNRSDLHWLMRPRGENSIDDREGTVFYELNNMQLSQRYKQFYENSELGEILRSQNLLKGVIVNEKFVRSSELFPNQIPIVRDVILIDTPGFNDESIGSLSSFKAYVRIFEFFYKQSHYCFFISDPSRLRSIGNALHILELTMADNEIKQKVFESVGKEISKFGSKGKEQVNVSEQSSSSGGGISLSLSNFIVDVAANALHRSLPFFKNKNTENVEPEKLGDFSHIGPSMYEKVYFVINKADKIRNLYYAYFEFGLSLGRFFQHFPLPHANRILAIGLPMEQRIFRYRYGFLNNGNTYDENDYVPYEKMFDSMKWDGSIDEEIHVAQLKDLESIIFNLRGEDSKKICLLHYIDFVYKSINNVRESETNRFNKYFRKIKHFYKEPWSRAQAIYKAVLNGENPPEESQKS